MRRSRQQCAPRRGGSAEDDGLTCAVSCTPGRGWAARAQSPPFWILARALRDFVADPAQGDGLLPLTGSIPDMESDTESYVQLQTM